MKQFKISGTVFKCLVLVGLLASCNKESLIVPTETTNLSASDQNAKLSPLTRLTKDNNRTIQYVKSGKLFGKISKVDMGSQSNYRYEYSYDDNNPSGDLWISKKQYQKSNNLFVQEFKYKVVNGKCVLSQRVAYGDSFEHKYNAQGLLDETTMIVNGNVTGSWKYFYNFNQATNSYRLIKIADASVKFGPGHEYTFSYTSTPDKYPLNYEIGNIDKYLPIYGQFSDVLPEKYTDNPVGFPGGSIENSTYSYGLDADGLVVNKTTSTSQGNGAPYVKSEILKYSANWQGI